MLLIASAHSVGSEMPATSVSKTGLIASPQKKLNRNSNKVPQIPNLSKCAVARPAQFSLRPFGGLFNPYAKGCSILCNHPGPTEVKSVVKQAKESWLAEGKGIHNRDDQQQSSTTTSRHPDAIDCPEHVPEEFFRRYTGSDSRPMTPTPTVISGRTRTSTGSYIHVGAARRCFTPDPVCSESGQDRKQLILDLRRSHSQETLYWNASSELSPAVLHGEAQGRQSVRSKQLRLCEQEAKKRAEEKRAQQLKADIEPRPPTVICINDQDLQDEEEDGPRRRGKRKKKPKPPTTSTYQVSQEPETQVATLDLDSANPSGRPSLVPGASNLPRPSIINADRSTNELYRQSSFISEDALQYLRRGLSIDVIEKTFGRYMNRARMEAYRTMPPDKLDHESEALLQYKGAHHIPQEDNEKWLSMPRRYTRNSARFTLPINTYDLTRITPFEYISRHIWISEYRKQLYQLVFVKYLPEDLAPVATGEPVGIEAIAEAILPVLDTRPPPFTERTISFGSIDAALGDVLGFHGTPERIKAIKELLLLNENEHGSINYRSWCGIVAFAERFLNQSSREEDRCDAIEIADFESLERKLNTIEVTQPLRVLLKLLKYH